MHAVEVGGTVSTFGQQILSTRPTNERTKFGSSDRHDGERMADPAYEYLRLGQSDPIGVEPTSAFGRQSPSRCRTAPAFKIGQTLKHDHSMGRFPSPGPGSYELPSSIGKQLLSPNEKLPSWRIGTGGRFSTYKNVWKADFQTPAAENPKLAAGWMGDAPATSFHGKARRANVATGLPGQTPTYYVDPGPGTYAVPSSLGKQAESRNQTAERARIGTADRSRITRTQYLSRDLEYSLFGKHSPAPNLYNPTKCLTQTSRIPKPSSFRFGSGDRFSQVVPRDHTNTRKLPGFCTPGPGSYVV